MTDLLNRLLYEKLFAAEGAGTAAAEGDGVDPAVAATADGDEPPKSEEPAKEEPAENGKDTIATGAEETKEEPAKPYWPEDWREKAAAHIAAGDEKVYKKELKQLERYVDPTAIAAKTRELEARFSRGGLVKVPGKDAKEEEVAEFRKALGIPEKAEDYTKDIQLENGAVIGDIDKPVVDYFAEQAHKDGMTPQAFNGLLNAYYAREEEQAAALDEADDQFKNESIQELKEEYGAAYRRYTNSVGSLFATAPGGLDLQSENSLYARLMGGRMADGKIIGNDPDMVRFLVSLSREVNPIATVTEGGDQSGKSVDAELKEIAKFRRENKREYFKDEQMQARERELLDAQARNRAKA
jgi:hypothetical protein